MTLVFIIIVSFILACLTISIVWYPKECPREKLGYNCKGRDCDHEEKL